MTTPPAPPARTRPHSVTWAAVLMYVLALMGLVWAGLTLATLALVGDEALRDQLRQQQPDLPAEQMETALSAAKALAYGIGALLVLLALAAAVLGFLVYRGNRVGRILSWVLTGFFALCGLCSLGGVAAGPGGAQGVVGALLPVVVLAVSIAVIVLLALPASHPYFAKPVPEWQPPVEAATPETPAAPAPQPSAAPETPQPPPAPTAGEESPQIGLGEPPARPWTPPPTEQPPPEQPPKEQ